MKKNGLLKHVSLLIVFLILSCTVLPFTAGAADVTAYSEEHYEHGDGVGMLENTDSMLSFFGLSASPFADSYYDQLDSDSKIVYDTLYSEYISCAKSDFITIPLSKTFKDRTITRSGSTVVISDADNEEISAWILDAIRPALLALVYDHPELCWLINASYMYGRTTNSFSFPFGSTKIVADITIANVRFCLSDVYTDTGDKASMDSAIANAKAEIDAAAEGSDGKSVLKAIHDYLCSTVTYTDDSDLTKRLYQTPYSAFYGERKTVCAGYSKAFKLLSEEYGIPCILVTGTGNGGSHMWNYVKLEGAWYAVDVTWDDQYKIFYDYFLCGSYTVSDNITNNAFSESHVPSGVWASGTSYVFNYPALSSDAYVHSHTLSYVEAVKPTSAADGTRAHYICASCGKLFSDEGGVTEVTASELVLVYCDVNADGKVNSRDIQILKKILSADAENNGLADISGDGKINSSDLLYICKYISDAA